MIKKKKLRTILRYKNIRIQFVELTYWEEKNCFIKNQLHNLDKSKPVTCCNMKLNLAIRCIKNVLKSKIQYPCTCDLNK